MTDRVDVAVWTGLTLGVTPALSALCAPLWGRVADRFGNKFLLLRALASCVVVMGLMAQAAQPWHSQLLFKFLLVFPTAERPFGLVFVNAPGLSWERYARSRPWIA